MKRHATILLSAFGILIFCAMPVLARDVNMEEVESENILDLSEIQANPDAFKTTTIAFRGQFHRLNQLYNPFYTIFDSTNFLNFSAWEFDAPLWKKESFKADFPLLYVDKRINALSLRIQSLPVFTRFEATGIIKSTFDNKPWILVTSLKVVPQILNKKSIGHMVRGYNYRKKGDPLNAVLEFSQSYAEELPLDVRILIRKEEGKSLFAMEYYEESVTALTEAQNLLDDNIDAEVEGLLKEASALAEYQEDVGRLAMYEDSEETVTPDEEGEEPVDGEAVLIEVGLEEDDVHVEGDLEKPATKEPENPAGSDEPQGADEPKGTDVPKGPDQPKGTGTEVPKGSDVPKGVDDPIKTVPTHVEVVPSAPMD